MDLVPETNMLRVELNPGAGFATDADAVSTCPLLTPSPPTNALVDPTCEPQEPSYIIATDELATKLKQVEDEPNAADSTSSNSSITAEPACVQLLNHHHYHHLTKNSEDANIQENGIKQATLQLSCSKTAEDYFFVNWNWPVIRKSCMWVFLSAMFACVALVIAMVATLPRTCNPPVQWYQGSLMYEIFPASYQDSNGDGIGDLKGLASRTEYISSLGVRAVRLNSIFPAHHYPEDYKNISSLMQIEPTLGSIDDFIILVNKLHLRNISLILDLPLWPFLKHLGPTRRINRAINKTNLNIVEEYIKNTDYLDEESINDPIADAIDFWLEQGVDGFYFKGLEHYVNSIHFGESIKNWKKMIGPDRVLIIKYDVIESSTDAVINILMNRVDLVDVILDLETTTETIRNQIESIQNGTLFSKPGAPWVHWSLGNVETRRLASRLSHGNATLGATLLQLMLPGTQSLFYGDEVGLRDVSDPQGDRDDVRHIHQLAAMAWDTNEKQFTDRDILPWMHGEPTTSTFSQRKLIKQMIKLREESPAIYVNSILKDGIYKANAEIKYSEQDILVIQRWYPRRNSYVIVTNLGTEKFSADLSKMFYGGKVVVGPRVDSFTESFSFKNLSLWPGESVVIELH